MKRTFTALPKCLICFKVPTIEQVQMATSSTWLTVHGSGASGGCCRPTAPPLPTSLCRDPAFVRCIWVKRDRLQERKSVISEHTQLSDGTHLGRGHIKGNTRISFATTRFSTDISAICVEILGWLVLGGKQSRTNIYMSLLTSGSLQLAIDSTREETYTA